MIWYRCLSTDLVRESHLNELEADVQDSFHPALPLPVLVDVSLVHRPRRIHNENHVLSHGDRSDELRIGRSLTAVQSTAAVLYFVYIFFKSRAFGNFCWEGSCGPPALAALLAGTVLLYWTLGITEPWSLPLARAC